MHRKQCKQCRISDRRKLHEINRPHIRALARGWYRNNREKLSDKNAAYRQANYTALRLRAKQHRTTDSYKGMAAEYARVKRATDPVYSIKSCLSRRLRSILDGPKRTGTPDFGCSEDELISVLGPNSKGTHIDHYVPCSLFDLTTDYGKRVSFNFRNLRRIPSEHNLRKLHFLPVDWMQRIEAIETAIL
jgi:hypothetical protein